MNIAKPVFDRAARLNDPGIEGFLHLAAGRCLTRTIQKPTQAAEELHAAYLNLMDAGRPPWALFAQIEFAKALADNQKWEEVDELLNDANKKVDRWKILRIDYTATRGKLYLMKGEKTEARTALEEAIELANKAQIPRRAEALQKYQVNYC